MKKFNNKLPQVNFFESPHPFHFDIRFALDLEDMHGPETRLFPLKPNSDWHPPCFQQSHNQQPTIQLPQSTRAWPLMQEQNKPQTNQIVNHCLEIDEKIEFSNQEQEELRVALTPKKPRIFPSEHTQQQTTLRKLPQTTPQTESRSCERGLKKLAYEAYMYVIAQRRTTYKEVARKLITQMTDQSSVEIEKKGEMNVKRRVYDALNVLIALGLLKRTGNRIVAKVLQGSYPLVSSDQTIPINPKDLELYQELMQMRSEVREKQTRIQNKQQIVNNMQQQIKAISQILQRNKALSNKPRQTIPMPFFTICRKNPAEAAESEHQDPICSLWSENGVTFYRGDASQTHMMGDMDLIAFSSKESSQVQSEKQKKTLSKTV